MNYDKDDIKKYLNILLKEPNDIMKFISESEKIRKDICPTIGKEIGHFLYLLIIMNKSKNILEIGTGIGYSTIWLALAAKENNGKVYSVDKSSRMVYESLRNIKFLKLEKIVDIFESDGENFILNSNKNYDFIFMDSSTNSYEKIYNIAYDKLKKGGIFVVVDIFFACIKSKRKKQQEIMSKFNKKLFNDDRFYKSIINLKNGITVCVKK